MKINLALSIPVLLFLTGCSRAPRPISDGKVTISVPRNWKASKTNDSHILLESGFVHPVGFDSPLATESISIHSHPSCLSDQDMAKAKSNIARSLFSHRPQTASWFQVETASAPLSCLLNETPKIKGIPNDLMLCLSKDGVSLVFHGRSSTRPQALEILKSIKTNVSCNNDQR